MTKHDAIIGIYGAGTPISKIIKQLKVPKSTVYDVVRRYKELRLSLKWTLSLMLYEKQQRDMSRDGKVGIQMLHEKNGSKINEDNCKN